MGGFAQLFSFALELFAVAGTKGAGVVTVWILVIVFAISGYAKFRRPVLAAMTIVDFGLLDEVRPTLGLAVGLGELTIALGLIAGLLTGRAFLAATVLAAILLWFFVGIIVRSLRAGERFSCFCFGDSNSELSTLTAIRTFALAILATNLLRIGDVHQVEPSYFVLGLVVVIGMLGSALLVLQITAALRGTDFKASGELT